MSVKWEAGLPDAESCAACKRTMSRSALASAPISTMPFSMYETSFMEPGEVVVRSNKYIGRLNKLDSREIPYSISSAHIGEVRYAKVGAAYRLEPSR